VTNNGHTTKGKAKPRKEKKEEFKNNAEKINYQQI
jgi:hypothetical protein